MLKQSKKKKNAFIATNMLGAIGVITPIFEHLKAEVTFQLNTKNLLTSSLRLLVILPVSLRECKQKLLSCRPGRYQNGFWWKIVRLVEIRL